MITPPLLSNSAAGGKIKVEIYPANQLGQIPATVEGVALGTIEAVSVANERYITALYLNSVGKAVLARDLGTAEQAVRQFLGGAR